MTAFDIDRHADRLARTQHGVFSRRQIIALGATRHMVSGRVGNGRWLELAPAVYALPSHPGTWHRALMTAVLAEWRAVVAGGSAAALHGLTGYRPGRVEIVVPSGRNHHSNVALIHRSDVYRSTRVLAIPVLTVCDSLFMVAGLSDGHRVQVALDDALASGMLTVEELQRRYLGFAGSRRAGLGRMRALIDERSGCVRTARVRPRGHALRDPRPTRDAAVPTPGTAPLGGRSPGRRRPRRRPGAPRGRRSAVAHPGGRLRARPGPGPTRVGPRPRHAEVHSRRPHPAGRGHRGRDPRRLPFLRLAHASIGRMSRETRHIQPNVGARIGAARVRRRGSG